MSKDIKDVILANKKSLKGSAYRIYEDLSPMNRILLKNLKDHRMIDSSWSDHGKILGKTAHGVIRPFSVTDNIDSVVKDMLKMPPPPPKPKAKSPTRNARTNKRPLNPDNHTVTPNQATAAVEVLDV